MLTQGIVKIYQLNIGWDKITILLNELQEGMILADQVETCDGLVLSKKGVQITKPVLVRLRNYHINMGVKQPIRVFMSIDDKTLVDFGAEVFDPSPASELIRDR